MLYMNEQIILFIKKIGITFFFLLIGLLAIDFLHISYPIEVTTTTRSSELAVVGEGKVEVKPDVAVVRVGITVNDVPTVQEARQKINETNNAIIAAMKELGISEEDIKTSQYSIHPSYDVKQDEVQTYDGNVSVEIKARSTDQVADITTRATEAGANDIYGTEFRVEDVSKYREEARNKAIEDARTQAQKLAKELGIRLGKVTNIVESSQGVPQPMMLRSAVAKESMGLGAGPEPDIEAGSQTIESTVTLYFEKR